MTPEQRARVENWLTALRSGRYAQRKGALRRRESFCCLGVLCEISPEIERGRSGRYKLTDEPDFAQFGGILPGVVFSKLTGLNPAYQSDLSARNDKGWTFDEIANHIESVAFKSPRKLSE